MAKRPGDPGYAPNWCIHYRYNRDLKPGEPDTCEASVSYDSLPRKGIKERPCFLDEHGQSWPGADACEHLRRPTPEEIAAHEEWIRRRIGLHVKVSADVIAFREANKGQAASAAVDCSACGTGKLHLSIARNGHVAGYCTTAGCLSWIE